MNHYTLQGLTSLPTGSRRGLAFATKKLEVFARAADVLPQRLRVVRTVRNIVRLKQRAQIITTRLLHCQGIMVS